MYYNLHLMTATGHAIIGTAIAAAISNPFIAIPVALLSHIPADLFPHWDPGTHRVSKKTKRLIFDATADGAIGIFISYLLLVFFFPYVSVRYAFSVIVAAQFLDYMAIPTNIHGTTKQPFYGVFKLQEKINKTLDKPWGIVNQAALLFLLITIVIYKNR